jgi:hypothetical protein
LQQYKQEVSVMLDNRLRWETVTLPDDDGVVFENEDCLTYVRPSGSNLNND